jgi:hypothetical protein
MSESPSQPSRSGQPSEDQICRLPAIDAKPHPGGAGDRSGRPSAGQHGSIRSVFPPAKGIRPAGVTLSSFDDDEEAAPAQLALDLSPA